MRGFSIVGGMGSCRLSIVGDCEQRRTEQEREREKREELRKKRGVFEFRVPSIPAACRLSDRKERREREKKGREEREGGRERRERERESEAET